MNKHSARRLFLRHSLGAPLGAVAVTALAACQPARPPKRRAGEWQNWSGAQRCVPKGGLQLPANLDELSALVQSAAGPVRVTGAGHSFSALVPTRDTLISLELLSGLADVDRTGRTATVWCGTRLSGLGEALAQVGQALPAQPDIDVQSLGGVLATATHSAGPGHQCMPASVLEMTLVKADGSLLTTSPDRDAEVFAAAQVSLGALGVTANARLQNRNAFKLQEHSGVLDLGEALEAFDGWQQTDRHAELFVFAAGAKALFKRMQEVPENTPPTIHGPAVEDDALEQASRLSMQAPWLNSSLQRATSLAVADEVRVGASHHIYPTQRRARFHEMEYAVPADKGLRCLRAVIAAIKHYHDPVFFPLEFRYVAQDDLWLSPYHGRPSATISVHQYHAADYKRLFTALEPIFWQFDGRPHWGKWHSLGSRQLARHYPRWQDFLRVRKDLDPAGKFLNDHLRFLFGV